MSQRVSAATRVGSSNSSSAPSQSTIGKGSFDLGRHRLQGFRVAFACHAQPVGYVILGGGLTAQLLGSDGAFKGVHARSWQEPGHADGVVSLAEPMLTTTAGLREAALWIAACSSAS